MAKYVSMAKLDQQRFDVEMELQQLQNQTNPQDFEPKEMKQEKSEVKKVAKVNSMKFQKVHDLESSPKVSKSLKEKKPVVQSQLSMDKNSQSVKFAKSPAQIPKPEKLKPKMYKNPFIAFVQLNSAKLGEKGAPATSGMKMCGEKWAQMST